MRDRPGIRCTMICVAITLSYLILALFSCPSIDCATQTLPSQITVSSNLNINSRGDVLGIQEFVTKAKEPAISSSIDRFDSSGPLEGPEVDQTSADFKFKIENANEKANSDRKHQLHQDSSTTTTTKGQPNEGPLRMDDQQQVHKLMSKQDLRRTFQVDNHEQVPEYEILKLTVSEDGSHMISPISDLGELTEQHNGYRRHQSSIEKKPDVIREENAEATSAPIVSNVNSSQLKSIERGNDDNDDNNSKNDDEYNTYGQNLEENNNNHYNNNNYDDENNINHKHKNDLNRQQQLDQEKSLGVGEELRRTKRSSPSSSTSSSLSASGSAPVAASSDITEDAKATKSHKSTTTTTTTTNSDGRRDRQQHPTTTINARLPELSGQQEHSNDDDKPIVMQLSTFGQEFRLKLKRNADFQARLKGMKMFMAESTGDGQLRYTEIRGPSQQNQNQNQNRNQNQNQNERQQQQQHQSPPASSSSANPHHQEPHKRAAQLDGGDVEGDAGKTLASSPKSALKLGGSASASSTTTTTTTTTSTAATSEPQTSSSSTTTKRPQRESHTATKSADLWNIGSTYHDEDNLAALLIERDAQTGQLRVDGTIGNDFVIKPVPEATLEAIRRRAPSSSVASQTTVTGPTSGASKSGKQLASELERAASHLHDDDPHDDDEMFLDEDEAFEMARDLRQTGVGGGDGSTGSGSNKHQQHPAAAANQLPQGHHDQAPQNQDQQQQQQQQLTVASNQTGSGARTLSKVASERKWRKYRKTLAQTQVPKLHSVSSSNAGSSARARRAATIAGELPVGVSSISHHIVYRQRPSSESSSLEHQDSPLNLLNSIRGGSGRLRLARRSFEEGPEVGHKHDHLSSQFLLEPAELNMPADWSLFGDRHSNSSSAFSTGNSSSPGTGSGRGRHKRSISGPMHRRHGPQVRRKRQAPDTVWPEVLLVVDYDSFLLHGGDSRDVKRYFVSFWNGVDLRYKLLVHPHIRISLAGMIVAKDRDATPYLERNRLRAPNADAVDAAGALTDMGKYLYREDRLPTYDLAVVITKLDMCRRRYEGGRCNRGTAGFAYVGGACVVNKRLEKVNSVAIIEDSGGFSGIIVAAHEVGHLLGCVHDGSPPPSYLGGPGAVHCPWEDGFIMSDLRHTERGFRWSQCSIEQFKHFLNGETATCLYNYPHESQMLHRLLPGTMLSLDEQCKRDRGTNACFKDARVCAQLFCFDSASGYCVSYRPAAEGSPCGEGQVCRNGKCVGEIENIIPDYTHHTQSVVASNQPALVRRAPLGPAPPAHLSTRLAYNGLSASSTSAATVPPEPASSKVASSVSVPSSPAIISSRMDTFPMNDGPTSTVMSNPSGQYGDRYLQSTVSGPSTSSLMLMSSSATTPTQQAARHSRTQPPPKDTKPFDLYRQQQQQQRLQQTTTTTTNVNQSRNQAYQQRNGLIVSSTRTLQTKPEQFSPVTNSMRYSIPAGSTQSSSSPIDHFNSQIIDMIGSNSNLNSNSNDNNNNNNLLTSSSAFQPRSQPLMLQQQVTKAAGISNMKHQQNRHQQHLKPQRSPFYDVAAGLDGMPHHVDAYPPIPSPSVQYT